MTQVLTRRQMAGALAGLSALAVAAAVLGLTLGSSRLDWDLVFAGPVDGPDAIIFWHARVPRVLAGLVLGGGLAAVGCVFQALLRNPLADPYVLGVSGGAALGGTLALVSAPLPVLGAAFVPLGAFGGALATTGLLWRLSSGRQGASAMVILLGGAVFNALTAAVVLLIQSIVDAGRAQAVLFWLMGSLRVETVDDAVLVSAAVAIALAVGWLLASTRSLNALALGDAGAEAVGVDVRRLRRWLLMAACLAVGAAVSVGGLIGFVGLVVPHALRLVLGPDHRLLVPASCLGGGAFLVLCDALARGLFPVLASELPVGVVTACLGGPVFLYLLWRERERLA